MPYCGGYSLLLWYFLPTVADKHYCGGLLCFLWQVVILRVVVGFAHCGGRALLWLVIMLDVVVFLRTEVDNHYL